MQDGRGVFFYLAFFFNLSRLSQILGLSLIASISLVSIFGTLEVLGLQNFSLFFFFITFLKKYPRNFDEMREWLFEQAGKGLPCVFI